MSDTEKKAETEKAEAADPKPVRKRKHKLPAGYVTPVEFRHMLVDEDLASDTLNSAQIYILSRSAKTNGMPVKHFDAAGNEYDELQTDSAGNTITRPGIAPEEGLEWWRNRPKRQPGGTKKAESKKEDGASADESAQETVPADVDELEEEFEEEEDGVAVEAE
jgi:hypothetical protein